MAVDKLVDSAQLDADLSAVADAIRAKGGTSAQLAFPAGFVSAVEAIPTGGGAEEAPLNDVNFIDYDGKILYSYSASEFAALESLPVNPTHSGLTAQGWNWTLAEAKAKVAACGKCDIGQMYTTSDGKSRIYCSFDEQFLSPYLGIAPNGTVVVDWGDNSATDTLTGTSLTTVKYANHTYAAPGNYCITLNATSGSFAFLGASQGSHIVSAVAGITNRAYALMHVTDIEIGANASIGANAFANCRSLVSITLPSNITAIGTSAFAGLPLLGSLTIPYSVTSIGTSAFSFLAKARFVSFPPNIASYTPTSLSSSCDLLSFVSPNDASDFVLNMFQNSYNLRSLVLPPQSTQVRGNICRFCYQLRSITIPSGVTSIAAYAFDSCLSLHEIHFKPTTPPTVANSSAFTNIPPACKIYVPTGSLSAYTSATNYPSSSTYTYVEE